jgi:hypothetical protein
MALEIGIDEAICEYLLDIPNKKLTLRSTVWDSAYFD